jgi:Na+(H+)/acetate symporter ActP
MTIDPWILTFSALTVIATIWVGFWSAKKSKTASDFFVAGRSVSVGWNASAISGEYLSAASFMGVAGMVMSSGYDALWYPVCYACGYLFLLLFIAGPLRRFGAYTIPDFAEGRFDSPLFRKIAVVFVLFIGFFYTMPQMKGAGTTLSYIFQDLDFRGTAFAFFAPHEKGEVLKGLHYGVGVFLVGAVITINVALGGMKGITLVQAFQYWAKMFAISVPIFVLMAVYGHYGSQVGLNAERTGAREGREPVHVGPMPDRAGDLPEQNLYVNMGGMNRGFPSWRNLWVDFRGKERRMLVSHPAKNYSLADLLSLYCESHVWHRGLNQVSGYLAKEIADRQVPYSQPGPLDRYEFDEHIKNVLSSNGITLVHLTPKIFKAVPTANAAKYSVEFRENRSTSARLALPAKAPPDATWLNPFGPLTTKAAKVAKLSAEESKPYSLLYTYSLIIALVCGTAGLPHILVRFYTNPDGVAAKRTTMWVMVLIGVFYLFPPVFGVMGRNLMPELYNGLAGVKGTDGVVLKLPRILNPVGRDSVESTSERSEASAASVSQPATNNDARSARADVVGKQGSTESRPTPPSTLNAQPSTKRFPWGSILSGITCAGAFAAFMSTFSGLLVSLTGALAHDVYGRMLNPKSTPDQRMRMFKVCAVLCGSGAILLGFFVEKFEINKMVGWAFAIAATSYFPLLFLSTWWRGVTMKGAATGMLVGGTFSLVAIASTMFADQAPWAKGLADFYASHPLLRILAEQPAIWALPLAMGLMIVISKLTKQEVPSDIRLKMLVLHAPEKLGLKQEYIQEHQHGH